MNYRLFFHEGDNCLGKDGILCRIINNPNFKQKAMAQINAYLTFNGNCGEAFEFYKSVFGGSVCHGGGGSRFARADSVRAPRTDNQRRAK